MDVKIPQLGESVSEGVITRWLKQNGDAVEADEPLLELETDKASMEIAAETAGRLEILQPQGSTVRVGAVVARITDSAAKSGKGAAAVATSAVARPSPSHVKSDDRAGKDDRAAGGGEGAGSVERARPAPEESARPGRGTEERPLSPAVRKLVAEHDVDVAAVAGTGKSGRVTKGDVLAHIDQRGADGRGADGSTEHAAAPPSSAPVATPGGGRADTRAGDSTLMEGEQVRRVPMTQLRRRIAERLVEAQRSAAILTTFNEIDLSELLALRKRHRERFQKKHGVDLGFVSLFGRACIQALADIPIINAQIEGGDIVYHQRVHLGIAVSTSRGLVVPVVRSADTLSLAELERAIGALAMRAREGKLVPDDLAGGTFTITNGGVFGSLLSTPILNPPQSAILGMHKIEERPVALEGQVVIRPMMYVALSYDHRLIDGEGAVTFLVRVKEQLQEPARMLLEV